MSYSEGWITVPGKGKRWRKKDGTYMLRQPAGSDSFVGKVTGFYQGADRRLGGWLPGGGTGNAASSSIRKAAASLRDNVVVPALDKGLETGVVPPQHGMFARYLTGTSKPMTKLPPGVQAGIKQNDKNRILHAQDRHIEDRMNSSPEAKAFQAKENELNALRLKRMQRGMQGLGDVSQQEITRIEALNRELSSPGINPSPSELSPEERKPWLQDFQPPRDYSAGWDSAYYRHPLMDKEITKDAVNTLGRYHVRDGMVEDRYDFNDLDRGPRDPGLEGGQFASSAIEAVMRLGILNPDSGYDIRAPLR